MMALPNQYVKVGIETPKGSGNPYTWGLIFSVKRDTRFVSCVVYSYGNGEISIGLNKNGKEMKRKRFEVKEGLNDLEFNWDISGSETDEYQLFYEGGSSATSIKLMRDKTPTDKDFPFISDDGYIEVKSGGKPDGSSIAYKYYFFFNMKFTSKKNIKTPDRVLSLLD